MRRTKANGEQESRIESAVEQGADPEGRTVYLIGEVNGDTVAGTMASLDVLDRSKGKLRLVLASGGGDVDMGMALYDYLKCLRNDLRVEAYGLCQSMAVLIMQAADVRAAGRECRVMVHDGYSGVEPVSPRALRSMSDEIIYLHKRYCEILAGRAGVSADRIFEMCREETFLSAEAAVVAGLVDEIIGA